MFQQGFGTRSNNVEMQMNSQISKWRPDLRNPISSEASEIISFRTNFTKQLDELAKNVEREITNTEAAVKEIKEALKRSIGKFNWSSEKTNEGTSWKNETYFNAAYINTGIFEDTDVFNQNLWSINHYYFPSTVFQKPLIVKLPMKICFQMLKMTRSTSR